MPFTSPVSGEVLVKARNHFSHGFARFDQCRDKGGTSFR